jgi:hypothetical protein
VRGIELFRKFRRAELTMQMRAAEDKEHAAHLARMRNPTCRQPVTRAQLDSLRAITRADVQEDASWAFAPIGTRSKRECAQLNYLQADMYARTFNLPLVKWRVPLAGAAKGRLDARDEDALFADERNLWGYFVVGAPWFVCSARTCRPYALH